MTKSEQLIRSILGPIRSDIRPLSYAVEIAEELLFEQKIPMDDIRVTERIYPAVAGQIARSTGTVARRVERLANLCWDALVERELVEQYIGEPIKKIRAPRDMIFYLANFIHFGKPFYAVIAAQPAMLF